MSSLAEEMRYKEVNKVPLNRTAKVLFEVVENGDNTVDLDAVPGGYRQYIHIRLLHVIKIWTNDTGTWKLDRTNNYYELRRCQANNFKTDFEKLYFEMKKSRSQYCIDHL